jgi:hypothetical protein
MPSTGRTAKTDPSPGEGIMSKRLVSIFCTEPIAHCHQGWQLFVPGPVRRQVVVSSRERPGFVRRYRLSRTRSSALLGRGHEDQSPDDGGDRPED